jgi:hypothetical protein
MVSVFKATRVELWAALKNANLTGDSTWKSSNREDMMVLCVKNNITEVKEVTESSDLAKKLSKVFTPEFFKLMGTVEATIAEALSDSEIEQIDSRSSVATLEPPEPELETALTPVKKN